MKYLSEILGFYAVAEESDLTTAQIALWHALMHTNNRQGWREWFCAPGVDLKALTGIKSSTTITECLKTLKKLGLIDYKTINGGRTQYKMKSISKNGMVTGAVGGMVTVNPLKELDKDIDISPLPPEGEAPAAQEEKKKPDYQRVLDLFIELCPSLPSPKGITKPRKGSINSAGVTLKKHKIRFQDLFQRVEASDFLSGRDGQWDKCGFDWILKPANLLKILEGNYDNKSIGGGDDGRWKTV